MENINVGDIYILACYLGVNAKIALKHKVICEGNFKQMKENGEFACVVLKSKQGVSIYKKEEFLQNIAKYIHQKRKNIVNKKQESNQTEGWINAIRNYGKEE